MKKILVLTILFTGILLKSIYSQDLLFVQDSMYIESNTSLYIQGGLKADGSALINNNGTMHVSYNPAAGNENWTNNVNADLLTGSGKVIFNSSEPQNIQGTDTTKFYDLEINNSSADGINLNISAIVQDTLLLYDGKINTGANYMIVTSSDSASITGYLQGTTTPSFINGNLRRYINSGSANSYGFPVGWKGIYYLEEILYQDMSGVIYLDAKFDTLDHHNNTDLNVTESGNQYDTVCNQGVWYLTPNTTPASADYNIRGYTGNFTSCNLQDNLFAILKRPDNSLTAADWDCSTCGIGIGLSPDDGEGRMLSDGYALRKNLTGFSQFGIGKFVPNNLSADAGPDQSICNGSSVQIGGSPTASNGSGNYSYNWSPSTGLDFTNIANPIANPGSTTEYFVTVTDTDNGLTNIDSITVTVNPTYFYIENQGICNGGIYTWHGNDYTTDGTYYDSLSTVNSCDSIYELNLTVNPIYFYTENQEICDGGTYTWHGNGYTIAGTYYDSLSTVNGCDSIYELNLTVSPISDATITEAVPFCLNDAPVNLTAVDMGGTWSGTGITDGINGTFDPFVAGQGIHTIIYTISGMCGDADTIDILVYPVPSISAQATGESCSGANDGSIDLTVNGGTLPYNFDWNNGDTTEDISDLVPDTYIIIVTDSNGCSVTDNLDVSGSSVLCYEPTLYIPNIFSPNGDGQNDVLYVMGKGIKEFTFIIYDRWGENVFETSNQSNGWDGTYKGKKLNTSVFTYYIDAVMLNNETIKRKGSITLMR